ncbi:MAG: DUF6517 family protein [Halalkalicoccus sp.]
MALSRRGLCSLLSLAAVGSAGCLDRLTGSEPTRFVAPPAPVAEETLSGSGYELDSAERSEETRTFEVAGQRHDVEVVNHALEYHRLIDMGPLGEARGAVFGTFCTPAVEVLGRTFNPIEDMSNRELADEVQSQYEELSVGAEIDRRTATLLDEPVELSKFEGEATFMGVGIDLFVHVALAEGDEEFVAVLGVYPRLLSGEETTIVELVEGVGVEED